MINYAIIGSGWITETYIAGTLEVEGMRLAGVYSRSEETAKAFAERNKAAAKGGEITLYTDLEVLAKDPTIQAVYVASPNRYHVPQSRLMLQNGKHVICEKPIAIHPSELEELQALAKANNLVYMEAIMMLHQPHLKALKEAVKRCGKIYTSYIDFSQLSSKYQAYVDGKNPNIFNPYFCTGALEDLGIYCFYMVLELFGLPEKFQITPQFLESGADCSGEVIMDYGDKHLTVNYCKVGQNRIGSQIMGDQGTVTIELISQMTNMFFYHKDGTKELVWGEEEKNHLMGNEAQDFAKYIRAMEAGTSCPAEETLGGITYEECSEKAMAVCRLLEDLRNAANIVFIED